MFLAQTIKTEWTIEKLADKRVQSKQTPKHNVTEQTECRQMLPAQTTKGKLSNNNNNVKDNVD